MAKKYLITLSDEKVEELQKYLNWRENLIFDNTGIRTKSTATGILTQIIEQFLSDLKY